MNKYPLKLSPYCKEVIWGGTKLKNEYGKECNFDDLGETWELSTFPGKESMIENGDYAGKNLSEYLGDDAAVFPVLVKFLDAADDLSIQVHPCKNEMWYIVEADENARIVYGLNDIFSTLKIANAVASGTLESYLNYVPVKKGDVFYIPSGLVHAICKGIVIAEIQQTNDTTYRLYDYNRTGKDGKRRELHISQALDTICDFAPEEIKAEQFSHPYENDSDGICLASSADFTVFRYTLTAGKSFESKAFTHILCISGSGNVDGVGIKKGDSLFIPPEYGTFKVSPDTELEIITTTK